MTDVLKQNKKFLLCITGIALFLRVIFFFTFLSDNPCMLSFDSGHYDCVAQEVAAGKGFSNPDGTAHLYRLPGYPLFLALFYKIAGCRPIVALLFQILLASFLPLLVFLLLLAILFPGQNLAARIAAIMTAMHPGFLVFSGLLMSEILFVFFFLLFLLFFCRVVYQERSDFLMLFFGGLLLGCASLIRPVGPYLIALAIVIVSGYFWKDFKAFKSMLGIGLGWFLLIGLWLVRNYLVTGSLLMHIFTGPHVFNHGATRIVMESRNISYRQAKDIVTKELEKRIKADDETRVFKRIGRRIRHAQIQKKMAWGIFLKHPLLTVKLFIKNMFKTVFSLYSSELLLIDSGGKMPSYDHRSFMTMIHRFLLPDVNNKFIVPFIYYELVYHVLLIFSFIGFFFYVILHRQRYIFKLLFMMLFMSLFIGLSGICGFARLRLPIAPLTIIGASIFLACSISKCVSSHSLPRASS